MNRRPEVTGLGCVIGLVTERKSSELRIHSNTSENPDIVSRIIEIIRTLELVPRSFVFSSIQILKSASVRRHKDANDGNSYIFTLGDYTGGALVVGNDPVVTFKSPYEFDGQCEHFVAPFEGKRWSVILYPHGRLNEASAVDLQLLDSLGFTVPLPSQPKDVLWEDAPTSSQKRDLVHRKCSASLSEFYLAVRPFGKTTHHWYCGRTR